MRKYSLLTHYAKRDIIKPVHPTKLFIPKSKNQKLDEYVKSHDTITKDYLLSIGVSKFPKILRGCERRCKVEILQINTNTWQVTK